MFILNTFGHKQLNDKPACISSSFPSPKDELSCRPILRGHRAGLDELPHIE